MPNQCILRKCPYPELCNDFSACDAQLLREEAEYILAASEELTDLRGLIPRVEPAE